MRAPAETPPSDVAQPPPSPRTGGRGWLREQLPAFIVVAVAGALVAAFFLGLYWAKHFDMPIGWDTPRYLDQANLVAAHGLAGVPDELPPPIKTLPSRGGTPIVLLTLSSLFGVSTFKVAAVVPPAAAMALALAAGALVTWTLRRGPWSLAAVALLVGTSAVVIRLMAPETYADNLFAGAILTAALVPLLASALGGGGFVAAVILIGAGAIAHSASFAVVALALVLGALVLASRIGALVATRGAVAARDPERADRRGRGRGRRDRRRRDLRRTPCRARHAEALARRAGQEAPRRRAAVPVLAHRSARRARRGRVVEGPAERGERGRGRTRAAGPTRRGTDPPPVPAVVGRGRAGRRRALPRGPELPGPPVPVVPGPAADPGRGRRHVARAPRRRTSRTGCRGGRRDGGRDRPRRTGVPRPLHDPRRPLPRRRVARRGQGPGRRDRCRVPTRRACRPTRRWCS